jgi:Raf kinase inhibitor-like YbhB/YbcL family protein
MSEQGFTLTSPAFVPDGDIPHGFTCDGKNKSPELRWMQAPSSTRSFALIVEDPDAPSGTFTHWVLFDIPAEATGIGQGGSGMGIAGGNDFHHAGYGGPCPPPNHGKHRYYFRLYALDTASLELAKGASRAAVDEAMQGHVLAETFLMGRYERRTG